MTPADDAPVRPYPIPDEASGPYWESAERGVLSIQRCRTCGRYHVPPQDFCLSCHSEDMAWEPVSGRGVVYGYTEVGAGARHPYWAARTPFICGIVELDEQPGLLLYTTFPGAALADLKAGAPVEVIFERLPTGQTLPEFVLTEEN
ncbi:Zn-ribbon domain-containing OB-fold protein [Streptomyces sp. NPDC059766]|uniref:Zn-ribbon domain-containing OB-fold protein n=1 Tax=Streptomyces sp. NPDC059766 TaxID=3346940 RepID=UPI00364E1B6E